MITGNYAPNCLSGCNKHYLLDKIKDFLESAYFFGNERRKRNGFEDSVDMFMQLSGDFT